jgi:hypothetical protein
MQRFTPARRFPAPERLMRSTSLVLSVLALALPITTSQAQATPRAGFWGDLSLGSAGVNVTCDICRGTRQTAPSASLRAGGTLNPRVQLGGEVTYWRRGAPEVTQRVTGVTAVAHFFPTPTVPAFVAVGAGYLSYDSSSGEDDLHAGSFALQVGAGYELAVRQKYVVVPNATFVHGFGLGMRLNDTAFHGYTAVKLLHLGIAVGVR